MKDFLNGAKFYHRIDVNPYWNNKMIKVLATWRSHILERLI